MANNRGKQFEEKFKTDWLKSFPNSFILRLYDSMNGFHNINTPCDYVTFDGQSLYLMECKSHDGASIPFDAIPQYERLLLYKDIKNVYPGVIVWYKDKDSVYWYSISELEKIKLAGYKSLNPETLLSKGFNILRIPSTKKRVFLDSDYSVLKDVK